MLGKFTKDKLQNGWKSPQSIEKGQIQEDLSKSKRVKENVLNNVTVVIEINARFLKVQKNDARNWLVSDQNDIKWI